MEHLFRPGNVQRPNGDDSHETFLNELHSQTKSVQDVFAFSLLEDGNMREEILQVAVEQCKIEQDQIEDIYPCTSVQEGLIALSVKNPNTYVARYVYAIPQSVDLEKFKVAWDTTVNAYTILRTRIIQKESSGTFQVVLRGRVEWETINNLQIYLAEDCKKEMQLGTPLIRVGMVENAKKSSGRYFVLTLHHALYDDWGLRLVLSGIEKIYLQNTLQRQPFNRFTAYSLSSHSSISEDFWRLELANMSASVFPTLPSNTYSPTATMSLERLIQLGTTPNRHFTSAIVKLGWSILLSQYTDSDEVVFGVTTTGRDGDMHGIEVMPGVTIATVPFRVHLKSDQRVEDALHSVQNQEARMIPFEQLGLHTISHLGPDAAAATKFQCLLVMQPEPHHDSDIFHEVTQEQDLSNHATFGTYALTLVCNLDTCAVRVQAVYDQNVVPEKQMKWMLDQFAHIMQRLNTEPYSRVDDLTSLGLENTRQLESWNGEVPERANTCMHTLIIQQCLAQPDAPAVCTTEGTMSYGELDKLSSNLAAYLIKLGVGPEVFVALYFEKSKWTTVGILAVMKAGGAFVLFDPTYPLSRLQEICGDIRATIVLSSVDNITKAEQIAKTVIPLGENEMAWREDQCDPMGSKVQPHNALYAIFTSGSTGKPKGLIIEHDAFCSSAKAYIKAGCLDRNTRALQFASYAFDVSISDTLVTLLAGGCICVPSEIERDSGLIEAIRLLRVNWADLTPSFLRSLSPQDLPTIQTLVLGGESMSKDDIAEWSEHVRLINIYGPAECCVLSTVQPYVTKGSDPSNIGFATGGACWIVDKSDHNTLMPIGAVGELLIEGPIVGRGYINEPDKTQSVFISKPPRWLQHFRRDSSVCRVYKTGDLAQYNVDGSIRFIGRKDLQVKLRGQRIELGDVEFHIRQYFPGVKDVVAEVVVLAGKAARPMLTAFVTYGHATSHEQRKAGGNDLLDVSSTSFQAMARQTECQLRDHLPRYMVPQIFIPLRYLPVTATGKTDRFKLRKMASSFTRGELAAYTTTDTVKRQPSTPNERTLHQLLQQVLKLSPDTIGMDDSFFYLGGDSIMAMKLVGMVRKAGVALTVADVFNHPKLSDLAHVMHNDLPGCIPQMIPFSLIKEGNREYLIEMAMQQCGLDRTLIEDIYPTTPLQEGMIAITTRTEGTFVVRHIFQFPGSLKTDLFQEAWNAAVEANQILRTRIFQAGLQGTFQVVTRSRIRWETADSVDAYIAHDADRVMHMGNPLLRLAFIKQRSDCDGYHFILTIHHSLCDALSIQSISRQVEAAYRGEELKVQLFSPFVEYVCGLKSNEVDDFWRTELADFNAGTFPALPHGGYTPIATHRIQQRVPLIYNRALGVTLSTMIRLAWGFSISQYTGSDDIVFGTVVTGRNAPLTGIEQIIGPTLATVPFRMYLQTDKTISEALQEVQKTSTRIISFEQAGLQNIRRLGDGPASACQFQNLLIIQPHDIHCLSNFWCDVTETEAHERYDADNIYGLNLTCELNHDSIGISATFDGYLIGDAHMERILNQFASILQHINLDSNILLADVMTISASDKRQLKAWNSEEPFQEHSCIHDLINHSFISSPEDPAVCAWDGNFTYKQLDRLSSSLAVKLTDLGVGPGIFVPLCFEKSKWVVVAILGVLRAGGAFILLEQEHPLKRLQDICQDVDAMLIVSSTENATKAAELASEVMVVGHDELDGYHDCKSILVASTGTSEDFAYVVFTSGSTGKPKGVVIQHRALCSSSRAYAEAVSLTSEARVLQFSSHAFDVCIADILFTMVAGGCVCIPSQHECKNDLAGAVGRLTANWITLTPSLLLALLPHDMPTLTTVIAAGEMLSRQVVSLWSGVRLINAYGPAECTVISTVQLNHATINSDPSNIGYANKASRCWVVDPLDHNNLTPIGAVGELLIGGSAVGWGYLNDPERTAQSFISSPYWLQHFTHDRCQLYKTGDLVQYAEDGTLRFIGRKDTQMKIRGQRVELAEVEHHVQQCFRNAEEVVAEVIASTETGRSPILVAFILYEKGRGEEHHRSKQTNEIIAAPSASFQSDVLAAESELHDLAPAYMIPAVFLPVCYVPLSMTGKIDRSRLKERAAALSQDQLAAYTTDKSIKQMPSTWAEIKLQQIWSQALNLQLNDIGVNDSFFRLGGDSITAMKLVEKARREGLILTVADVFKHPKLSDLATVMCYASESSLPIVGPFALLNSQEAQEAICQVAMKQCRVERCQIEDIYPCTALQEGLMALTAKKTGAYVAQSAYELPVGVDLDRFRAAWEATVEANAILRTRIIQTESRGMFQVVVRSSIQWEAHEYLAAYTTAGATSLMRLGGALARFSVVEQQSERNCYVFILTLHHALFDGWSLPLVLGQVAAAYQGQKLQKQPFNSFIAYLSTTDSSASENFWRSEFADFSAAVFPALPSATHAPVAAISLEHSIRLGRQAETSFTMSTAVRLAWAIVLSRYTDSNDVVFGVTVAGRSAPVADIELMTGPTIATVPLRIHLRSDTAIEEALRVIQRQSIEMIPFEQAGLQNIARLGPEAASACQFQSLLVIQPPPDVKTPEIFVKLRKDSNDQDAPFNSYALTLVCNLCHSSIDVQATFDVQAIAEAQMQRILLQFEHVLQQVIEQPQMQIGDVSAFSSNDFAQLRRWNQELPTRLDRCMHDLIGQRCLEQPDAPAVCSWDGDFTYSELDQLSSRLAAHLVSLGVGPEVFVPLCFEKSKWTTVAMLGVMKAGGAFVLLDPSHPVKRLQGICQDVRAKLAVCSAQNAVISAALAAVVVTIGEGEAVWRDTESEWTGSSVEPHNALYAVFTSGTTGKPKGVVIEHAAFCTGAEAQSVAFFLNPSSRVLQFASYAFDTSLMDHLTTLFVGGCVCVPSDVERNGYIASAVERMQVNWTTLTPSVSRLLRPSDVPTIKTLVLAGEAMSQQDIALWLGEVLLICGYGPAECSVNSTAQSVIKPLLDPQNIGYATGGVCWVVDRLNHDKLAPIGAIGELLVGGPIVGRGYVNDDEKTRAVFIESPPWLQHFQPGHQGRLYKTGDLVQYNPDGSIRFIGRKDTQVKLRGQRIELGEVEEQVRRCFRNARDVVAEVVVPAGDGAVPVLAAFVWTEKHAGNEVGEGGDEPSLDGAIFDTPSEAFRSEALRVELGLRDQLPSYMVPAVFIPLQHVPLSNTGKTDRRLLRQQSSALSRSELAAFTTAKVEKRSPSTDEERTLQRLFALVLNLQPITIGADDSFFRLGGDSIAAMKLVGAAREENLALTVADIFRHPKLSDLAQVMCDAIDSSVSTVAPFALLDNEEAQESICQVAMKQCRVELHQIEDIYPCTALQEGLISLTARKEGAYVAQSMYELPVGVDLTRFRAAWEATVEANAILRTRIIQTESRGMFQVVVRSSIKWEAHEDLPAYTTAGGTILMRLGGALARFAIAEQQSERNCYVFILTLHHALYDGWSLPLVLGQVAAAYQGQKLQKQPFNSFIAYLSTTDSSASEDFWRSEFADFSTTVFPSLPSATYVPAAATSMEHSIDVRRQAETGFTMSTAVRLAWAIVLSQYTDSNDVVFGVTVAGRSAPVAGIELMTGPTIATVPLRIHMRSDAAIEEALRVIQRQSIVMIPFEQAGLQNIARLGPEAAAACQFQSLLVIQPESDAKAPDIFAKPREDSNDQGASFNSYPLTLVCNLSRKSIEVQATFDVQAIAEAQMQRILLQFEHVLQQVIEQPQMQIGDVSAFSSNDFVELRRWNQELPTRLDRCMHDLISQRCLEQPDAPAVCSWDGDFTYGELDQLSSRLASHLASLGVGPEVFVPLCFEKSKWTTVAMLGVMKAGGAFVLLDLSHPVKRLQGICQDVRAKLAVCSTRNAVTGAALAAVAVTIGEGEAAWYHGQGNWTGSSVKPHNALYAVFTSGSTGKPKGVIIEHAAFCTSAKAHSEAFSLNTESRVLQFASYAFDVSLADHLTTLFVGGCVCVPSDTERNGHITRAVQRMHVNWAKLTPSVIRLLLPVGVPALKTLVLGGEAMSQQDMAVWGGRLHLICSYGPAECSVVSTVQSAITLQLDPQNIGYATGGVCWIVDQLDHDKLAPIGAVGELLIEGAIVGRGYVNDEDKTRAAFIEGPPWLQRIRPGDRGRLYKTGDLVQYNSDGSIRFIGRKDTQVKLRGQRIELGEVEEQVRRCFQNVRDVVAEVVVPAGDGAVPILAAFVWTEQHAGNEIGEGGDDSSLSGAIFDTPSEAFRSEALRVELGLRDQLPSYMVPAVFIPLQHVPLSSAGKTDRRLLRQQSSALSRSQLAVFTTAKVEKRPPSTDEERTLQRLFALVLNLQPITIGADDSFFRLGGDSIAAMKLVGTAREEGLTLTVADVFNHPKLSDLARVMHIDVLGSIPQMMPLSLIKEENREYLIEMAMQQCDLDRTLIEAKISQRIIEVLPTSEFQRMTLSQFYCRYIWISLPDNVDQTRLLLACQQLVQHHAILRTAFAIKPSDDNHASEVVQLVLRTLDVQFIQHDAVTDLAAFCAEDSTTMAIPTDGQPPFQVHLVTLQPDAQRMLVLRLPHAQFDGLSISVICGDLAIAYNGQPLPLAASFADHIHSIAAKRTHEAYRLWRRVLQGAEMTSLVGLRLHGNPEKQENGTMKSVREGTEPLVLRATKRILLYTPPSSITMATVVKTAWGLALMQLLASHRTPDENKNSFQDVVFGQVVHGRGLGIAHEDRIVGPCLNIIPVRMRIPLSTATNNDNDSKNKSALLLQVHQQHIETMPYENLGLQEIVQHSTAWPLTTKFGSFVRFQNFDEGSCMLDGVPCETRLYSLPNRPSNTANVLVVVTKTHLEVTITVSDGVVNQKHADGIVNRLCDLIQDLCKFR